MPHSFKDYNLAAYLIVSGCTMTGYSRQDNLTVFEFAESDRIKDLVEAYYSLKATVNPMTFGNALRTIRTIIHSEKSKLHATNYVQQPDRIS
jgi:hypothetical protein